MGSTQEPGPGLRSDALLEAGQLAVVDKVASAVEPASKVAKVDDALPPVSYFSLLK